MNSDPGGPAPRRRPEEWQPIWCLIRDTVYLMLWLLALAGCQRIADWSGVSRDLLARFFLAVAPGAGIVYFLIRVVRDFWNLWRR